MARKHKHRNHGPWARYADGSLIVKDGNLIRIPARRAHGLFKNVKPSPSALRRAEQRKHVYANSSASPQQG